MMLEWSVETVAMWRSLLHVWSLSVSVIQSGDLHFTVSLLSNVPLKMDQAFQQLP